jgi:hypothetical protein
MEKRSALAIAPDALPVAKDSADQAPDAANLPLPRQESQAVTTGSRPPVLPAAENFAFAVRMLGLDNSPAREGQSKEFRASLIANETVTPTEVPQTQSPVSGAQLQEGGQPPFNAPRHDVSSSSPKDKLGRIAQEQSYLARARQISWTTPRWNNGDIFQSSEAGNSESLPEPVEASRLSMTWAAQETHLLAPEAPRASVSSEILLHLPGIDQSSAAIRVADRAGSINVSVHTSDPLLRESLRSNLGDLSAQLGAQGWKTDITKSAGLATHSESQPDPRGEGQRGSQQNQTSGGDRQPPRDRRANSDRWLGELDQQITGGDAHPGGNA